MAQTSSGPLIMPMDAARMVRQKKTSRSRRQCAKGDKRLRYSMLQFTDVTLPNYDANTRKSQLIEEAVVSSYVFGLSIFAIHLATWIVFYSE